MSTPVLARRSMTGQEIEYNNQQFFSKHDAILRLFKSLKCCYFLCQFFLYTSRVYNYKRCPGIKIQTVLMQESKGLEKPIFKNISC